ncbi:MAG: tectonin domain-containing protein [Candidatus Brocadiia bacterium]
MLVNSAIFYRTGINLATPYGTGWDRVPGKLAQVAVQGGGVWAVNDAGGVWYRDLVTEYEPAGTTWERVPGTMTQVAAGIPVTEWTMSQDKAVSTEGLERLQRTTFGTLRSTPATLEPGSGAFGAERLFEPLALASRPDRYWPGLLLDVV